VSTPRGVSLEAKGVRVRHGAREVVRGISCRLEPGVLWAVLGPNGAGKSTLLRAMAGLMPLGGGEVFLGDRPLSQWTRRQAAQKVAWLSQSSEDASGFTGLEYVLLGRSPHLGSWGIPSEREVRRAEEVLETLGLRELRGRGLSQLSGGERRLLAVARAFVQEAEVLLLDEPTAFLDLKHQVQVLEQVRGRVREGAAAVVILHDVNLAEAYADQVLLMREGEPLAQGSVSEVLSPERLEALFGVRMRQAIAGGQRLFGPELSR
jgi:iron complex transport system ATP-binding protein